MPGNSASPPQLIVTSGRIAGRTFNIPAGYCEIGRLPRSGILLDEDGVSRRHAAMTRTGRQVVVKDLGSMNGTYVNGRRLNGPLALADGDRLRIGQAELRLSCPGSRPPPAASYGFGDVHGPVNAGRGQQYVAGRDQFVAGRDLYGDDYSVHVNADYDPSDELFQGRGLGRFLMVVGTLISMAGGALFLSVIASIWALFGSETMPDVNPLMKEVFGIPAGPGAIVLGVAGAILASVGQSLSKAARKRAEERERRDRRRRPPRDQRW
ncbi:FHA domain-containing protein [Streptomyces sp. NPDC087568]|uniref:FHA domain-containing protein n=1 Tax=unclassified Streptomyces TaxID=2593676 RepID=UPI0037F3EF41